MSISTPLPSADRCPPEFRLEALRRELEADLEMRLRVAPVGMEVNRIRDEARTRLQQPRGVEAEEIGVAADFVDRPRGGARSPTAPTSDRPRCSSCGLQHASAPDHVMEDVAAADRLHVPSP